MTPPVDQSIIQAARAIMVKRYVPGRHCIGVAATHGDTDISQIVAVTESGDIVPPCGMCRELISDYAPDAGVLLEIEGKVTCVPVLELLPDKYDRSKYPNRREQSGAEQRR